MRGSITGLKAGVNYRLAWENVLHHSISCGSCSRGRLVRRSLRTRRSFRWSFVGEGGW